MSVLLLGLSHKTAPVEVRERFAIAEQDAGTMVGELVQRPGIAEAMVLSTCNRVEFLVRSETNPDPTGEVIRFLSESRRLPIEEGTPFLYRYINRDAVRHIFRVSSSLDSMVLGEPQILGQVKNAYTLAKAAGALRGELDQLLNGAFRVARRVRNETGIGQMAVSISYVAVELARKIFGDLQGLSILIIGAGKMASLPVAQDLPVSRCPDRRWHHRSAVVLRPRCRGLLPQCVLSKSLLREDRRFEGSPTSVGRLRLIRPLPNPRRLAWRLPSG